MTPDIIRIAAVAGAYSLSLCCASTGLAILTLQFPTLNDALEYASEKELLTIY